MNSNMLSSETNRHSHARWMLKINVTLFCALWFLANPGVPVGCAYFKPQLWIGLEETSSGAHELFGPGGTHSSALKPHLDHKQTISQFQKSNARVMLLDYDGTLVNFHDDPDKAVPSEDLLEVLEQLNQDQRTRVAIISGRDRKFLQKHFGQYENFLLSAEHGAFERHRGATDWKHIPAPNDSWKKDVKKIMGRVQESDPDVAKNTWIETKDTGIVFHYRILDSLNKLSAMNIANQFIAQIEEWLQRNNLDFLVEHDACAIDVRPKQFAKGTIAASVWKQAPEAEMVLCLGDGRTDEAMFQSLHEYEAELRNPYANLITAHVDHGLAKPTLAKYQIDGVQSLNNLLRAFYNMEPKSVI